MDTGVLVYLLHNNMCWQQLLVKRKYQDNNVVIIPSFLYIFEIVKKKWFAIVPMNPTRGSACEPLRYQKAFQFQFISYNQVNNSTWDKSILTIIYPAVNHYPGGNQKPTSACMKTVYNSLFIPGLSKANRNTVYCLAKGHNTLALVGFEPPTFRSLSVCSNHTLLFCFYPTEPVVHLSIS